MRPRRTSPGVSVRRGGRAAALVQALIVLLAIASPLRASGLLDPRLRFHRLRTEHFIVYFHDGEEPLARRLAALVEHVRTAVGVSLHSTPPRLTHVILADQSEQANGWATPLPRNTVFLSAAAPSGADFIGRTDDWLRLVFTHEYTHVAHLDRSGGWARVIRGVFGRTAVAFPNLWLPQWQVEGLATFEESALTGEGRLHAGDFLAIERLAAVDGHSLTLDRASGGLVAWPDGHAAYAAGLGFHAYLSERFGERSLGTLADASARTLPFFGTRAFRRVYGESLGTLWASYQAQLAAESLSNVAPVAESHRLTHHGNIVVGPRFAPLACISCSAEIVYSARTPDAFPSLRAVGTDGQGDRQLARRYLGATTGLGRTAIVFDQQELRRNVGLYSDLYVFDRPTGRIRALTSGARLQDPDLSPDGRLVAAVRESGGQRDLVVVRLRGSAEDAASLAMAATETVVAAADVQFSAPRWSPDGRWVVAERRRLGALPDLVVIDVATREIVRVIADRTARIVTPAWRPDGRAIVAAADFDEQPFDLYEFPLDDETGVRRLTQTAGALWPDVASDGHTIVFAGYTADGYDVFTAPYGPVAGVPTRALVAPVTGASVRVERADALSAESYSPLGTIALTTWTPLVLTDANQTRLGGSLTGADVLGRHAYAIDLSWLLRGPSVVRPPRSPVPDWSIAYAYTRWTPNVFASASTESLFRILRDDAASHAVSVGGVARELQAGVFLPLVRVRHNTQALVSLVRTDSTYRLPDRDRRLTLVSSRLALAHDTTERHGYSIGREHGVNVGGTVELARRALGSSADATTTTLDLRAYVPGPGLHHVVALRAAGGWSTGSDLARQAFGLGAVAASPGVIDFSGDALGLLRGSGSSAAGSRLLVGNFEYRLPLAVVERGHGTWPLFLRTVHAALFADLAQVRGGEQADTAWRRALGGELSLDGVAGYGLPFSASLGAAWGHDGHAPRGASVYARIGRSF